jgi:streptomycin 6-kinase
VVHCRVPELDDDLRRRLQRRFGPAIERWLDELPCLLAELAERWQIEFGPLIPRGSMSAVMRCRTADGRPAVLKVSPDGPRAADEAVGLARWRTVHVPALLAVDETAGALLIEAVEPGTPLVDVDSYPRQEDVAELITALHAHGLPHPSYRPVAERIAHLYDSGLTNYERKPELVALVAPKLYEQGRRRAMRLAEQTPATVLLHGDLTPSNVLGGGEGRGLVAIDPAPCLGDPAFDAIDLVLWRAEDVDTIADRAQRLAPAIDSDPERLLAWCSSFAAMIALEIAEAAADAGAASIEPFMVLAEART